LREDIENAFRELTKPLAAAYSLEGVDLARPETLTDAQANALRFRRVIQEVESYETLAKFIDAQAYHRQNSQAGIEITANPGRTICEIAQVGAAVPEQVYDTLVAVRDAIKKSPDKGKIFAEAVKTHLQQRERGLQLRAALNGIAEFNNAAFDEHKARARVDDEGGLELHSGFRIPPKHSLGQAAATILDCPAAHVQHKARQTLSPAEKLEHGGANYIDHILAIVFNEAYERGALGPMHFKT